MERLAKTELEFGPGAYPSEFIHRGHLNDTAHYQAEEIYRGIEDLGLANWPQDGEVLISVIKGIPEAETEFPGELEQKEEQIRLIIEHLAAQIHVYQDARVEFLPPNKYKGEAIEGVDFIIRRSAITVNSQLGQEVHLTLERVSSLSLRERILAFTDQFKAAITDVFA